MLDTRHAVATPEGVDLTLAVAGAVPRATAWGVDLLIRIAIMIAIASATRVLGKLGAGPLLVMAFLIEWFYPVAFEVLANGATPGKRMIGLCVVESDGRPVGVGASVVRNLLRAADFLPFLFGFGILFMLFHPRFQRLGDLAAGTLVVWAASPVTTLSLPDAPVLSPPLKLQLQEQQALIAFAERSTRLSQARQEELAELLEPLTQSRGTKAVQRLLGMARYLAGER